jgi:hypothetical protein
MSQGITQNDLEGRPSDESQYPKVQHGVGFFNLVTMWQAANFPNSGVASWDMLPVPKIIEIRTLYRIGSMPIVDSQMPSQTTSQLYERLVTDESLEKHENRL